MLSFSYKKPTDEEIKTMEEFRKEYAELYSKLEKLPKNRGTSLALTKLEESNMWLNKGVCGHK